MMWFWGPFMGSSDPIPISLDAWGWACKSGFREQPCSAAGTRPCSRRSARVCGVDPRRWRVIAAPVRADDDFVRRRLRGRHAADGFDHGLCYLLPYCCVAAGLG